RGDREARADAARVEADIRAGVLTPPPEECALTHYAQAAARHPGHPALAPAAARLAAALVAQGEAALAAGRWDSAITLLESAAPLAPSDREIPAELARAKRSQFAAGAG